MPPLQRDFHKFVRISTATTTIIHAIGTGGGLVRIMVNGGTLGAITVYDNGAASGTVVASWTPAAAGNWEFGVKLSTGLTVVTAAATELTVVYE
ncbi:MAG: hypothetical protein ACWGQW_04780 [bacterium]